MTMAEILDGIAAAIAAKMPELKTAESVGGRIDLDELRRRSSMLPAAYVALAGTRDCRIVGGTLQGVGLWAVVLAVASRTANERHRAIAVLAGRGLAVVAGAKFWGLDGIASGPDEVESTNAYTTTTDDHNVALWVITWEQDFSLDEPLDEPGLADLKSVDADWQMAESRNETDAEDSVNTLEE